MNRKEFLSIIPALSSLPFISKEIIREKDAIIIPKAKEIEVCQEIPDNLSWEGDRVQFLLVHDGQVIGSAGVYEIGMSDGMVDEMSLNISQYVRAPELTVRARFNHDKVIKAYMNARRR
jgi:hypothetical protein